MVSDDGIHIYIGCTESQRLIAKVLAWSVLRRTRRPVRFYPLYEYAIAFTMPKDLANRPGTPFSFQRFMIPEIAGYQGRAIYMDSDQIVFKDIARLNDRRLGKAPLACRYVKHLPSRSSSMMLLDCSALDWQIGQIVADLDQHRYSYDALFALEGYPHTLPRTWNALDSYHWPFTALLHLTNKRRQPWINHCHRLGYLWLRELFSALDAHYLSREEVEQAIDDRLIRPSLAYQIEHRLADSRALPDAIKAIDAPFIEACAANQFNNVPGEYGVRNASQPDPGALVGSEV
jgi:hypothetical protein